ncbi:BrnT family toxin [Methylobacterium sp. CM6247]
MLRFIWDPVKAASNLRKHRVTFAIATRVFADPYALMEQDRIEGGERRWLTVGLVDGLLVLAVAHRHGRGGRFGVDPDHLGPGGGSTGTEVL